MSEFEITVLRKRDGALSKRISLTKSGKIKADGSACRMSNGRACRVELDDVSRWPSSSKTWARTKHWR